MLPPTDWCPKNTRWLATTASCSFLKSVTVRLGIVPQALVVRGTHICATHSRWSQSAFDAQLLMLAGSLQPCAPSSSRTAQEDDRADRAGVGRVTSSMGSTSLGTRRTGGSLHQLQSLAHPARKNDSSRDHAAREPQRA